MDDKMKSTQSFTFIHSLTHSSQSTEKKKKHKTTLFENELCV